MGARTATRSVLLLLFTVVLTSCSSTSADPPSGAEIGPSIARSSIAQPLTTADGAPAEWPDRGWLRLDVDVVVVLDAATEVDAEASLAVAWSPDEVEIWIASPHPDDPDALLSAHRTERGVDAQQALLGLQGEFAAGLATGLEPGGPGPSGGETYRAVAREGDTTASEHWEIGSGPAPWPADGPFDGGS